MIDTLDQIADRAARLCSLLDALTLVNDAAGGPRGGAPEVDFTCYRARLAMIETLRTEARTLRDDLDKLHYEAERRRI